jgi:hypothetical protein
MFVEIECRKMKKSLKKTQRQGWLTLLSLIIIAIAVSIGFSPLFELIEGGIAGAFVGSSFGAIFVIILTMFLLNKQTEIEQESKKSERVFDEKVKIYQIILDICSDTLIDGKLTQEEINRLPFPLIRLQMLAGDEVIQAFQLVFDKLNSVYEEDGEVVEIQVEDKNEIYKLLGDFSNECRKDLEISNVAIKESIQQATVNAISQSNKKINDQTKFKFDGKMLPKSQYVYSVVTNYLNENPQLTLEQFKDRVFDRDFDNRKGQYETWKTYKEVMHLHYNGSGAFRYYVSGVPKDIEKNTDKVIKLADEEICLSRNWGIGNMAPFRELMKSKNIRIE